MEGKREEGYRDCCSGGKRVRYLINLQGNRPEQLQFWPVFPTNISVRKNMIELFTIGFTKKSAEVFFELLKKNNIRTLIDIRLNNVSQLAGYTKKEDLKYFLKKICNIDYLHITDLAPTDDILKRYRTKIINWIEYESLFKDLLNTRHPENYIKPERLDYACLLCSECDATHCHRRLVAEYFKFIYKGINIIHI
jgi:uncharacterized protein (DUF488 family)